MSTAWPASRPTGWQPIARRWPPIPRTSRPRPRGRPACWVRRSPGRRPCFPSSTAFWGRRPALSSASFSLPSCLRHRSKGRHDRRPSGRANEGRTAMADNGQMIVDLDRKRMQAMAAKDVVTLEAVLADDLVYTHSSARLDTKQSLIGAMVSGAALYTGVEPSGGKAQDLGAPVVLTGVAEIKVVSNGTANAFGVRFTDVYARRDGRWQMVTWQSTRLPA